MLTAQIEIRGIENMSCQNGRCDEGGEEPREVADRVQVRDEGARVVGGQVGHCELKSRQMKRFHKWRMCGFYFLYKASILPYQAYRNIERT